MAQFRNIAGYPLDIPHLRRIVQDGEEFTVTDLAVAAGMLAQPVFEHVDVSDLTDGLAIRGLTPGERRDETVASATPDGEQPAVPADPTPTSEPAATDAVTGFTIN